MKVITVFIRVYGVNEDTDCNQFFNEQYIYTYIYMETFSKYLWYDMLLANT